MEPSFPSSSTSFSGEPDALVGPRDLAALQRDVLEVMRRQPVIFIALPFVFFLPFDLVNEFISAGLTESLGAATGVRTYARVSNWIQLGVGSLVAATTLQAVLMMGTGQPLSASAAIQAGLAAWGRAFRTTFITGFLTGLGLLAFIVPGVVLAMRWACAIPAAVIDDVDNGESRRRSVDVMKRIGGLRLFGWALGGGLTWYAFGLGANLLASFVVPEDSVALGALVSGLMSGVLNVIGAGLVVAVGLLYLEHQDRPMLYPVGLVLRDAAGQRVPGPTSDGRTLLLATSIFGALAVVVLLPVMAFGLWMLVDADGAQHALEGVLHLVVGG